MAEVGIIVNPFSGTDLRRLTSQASIVGNPEKTKKTIRMIRAMDQFGVKSVVLMPDSYFLNKSISYEYHKRYQSDIEIKVLDFVPNDDPHDTVKAVEKMCEQGIKCLIAMGGDGTSRLTAKVETDIPFIPVSTGTNNAYPQFWEGTNVGIAAAFLIRSEQKRLKRDKIIEIYKNEELTDIAVVDAVVTNVPFVGCRVVAEMSEISEVIVCRCSPDVIGLSALVGAIEVCDDADEFGYRIQIGETGDTVAVPFTSGQIELLTYSQFEKMPLEQVYSMVASYPGTIALDGERTVTFNQGDKLDFKITRNGPYKVNVASVLKEAVESGYFKR
ncbi:NAD(+)/NADH kinase [Fusibacter paucivorans]|uniref:NAD(+)/NADH kinase n=1 Tax=Fusibacter paucivorans TaxID=76009 RepID=A0ABS5PUH1_9FIRM|nr:NAD(+)/NADH kinase [Fusibacter paucivorans]MBS7528582.1 NAD(+)/NADH kinase [Fusibacter paucivorans]